MAAAPDILSDSPVLTSRADWDRATGDLKWRFGLPTPFAVAAEGVSQALTAYELARVEYERVRKEFNEPPSRANNWAQTELAHARSAHEKVAEALEHVADAHELCRNIPMNAAQRQAFGTLGEALERGQRSIDKDVTRFDDATRAVDVPGRINLTWVGGVPGLDVTRSAEMWAATQPNTEVIVWTDARNLLANDFRRNTVALRIVQGGGSQADVGDPAVAARTDLWKDASRDEHLAGLDARLRRKPAHEAALEKKQQELTDFRQQVEGAQFPNGSKIKVRDVSELFQQQPGVPHPTGALDAEDRARLHEAYQREIGERCNPGGGSDLARLGALHDHPGYYFDIDMIPPVAGLKEVLSAWNQVAANSRLPEIDGSQGLLNLHGRPYEKLMAAVDEHIAGLSRFPQPGSAVPTGRRMLELLDYVRPLDSNGVVTGALEKWSRDTTSLDRAFERLQPLQVVANQVRFVRPTEEGSVSNAGIATSTAGSPGTAEVIRQLVDNTDDAVKHRRGEYFNDGNRDAFRAITLEVTGPDAIKHPTLQERLKRTCGVADPEQLRIPFEHFPDWSAAQKNTSWLAPQLHTQPRAPDLPRRRANSLPRKTETHTRSPSRTRSLRS